jgi:hypothetical protein
MSLRNWDRVRDTSTTTGTGNTTVSGAAPATYITFSQIPSINVNDTFFYGMASQTLNEYETGLGTWLGSNVFARTSVFTSSNANSLVNFSAGTKDVWCGPPSSQFGYVGMPLVNGAASTVNYTAVLYDQGQMTQMNGSALTYAVPANASVAFPIGAVLSVVNLNASNLSVAVTTDTLILSGSVITGTRTLSQNGIATLLKVASTIWLINGVGIS